MDAYLAVASNRRGQRGTANEVLAGAPPASRLELSSNRANR